MATNPQTFDWKFKTFDDKTLEAMLQHAKKFVEDLVRKKYYFLTLSGPTEVGKTYLLDRASDLIVEMNIKTEWSEFYPLVVIDSWKTIMRKMLDHQNYGIAYLNKLKNCGVLCVSEFMSHDTNGPVVNIMIDLAHELIDLRAHRPMLIDSNRSLTEIELLDVRIASRLKRDGGIFVNINPATIPYSKRK